MINFAFYCPILCLWPQMTFIYVKIWHIPTNKQVSYMRWIVLCFSSLQHRCIWVIVYVSCHPTTFIKSMIVCIWAIKYTQLYDFLCWLGKNKQIEKESERLFFITIKWVPQQRQIETLFCFCTSRIRHKSLRSSWLFICLFLWV